jgi:Holliday junction DNA helicase RuvB
MRSRFGVISRLDYYNKEVLSNIIDRSSNILGVKISKDATNEIALRSRGTPRIANNLLKRARDFAQVKSNGEISIEIAKQTLDLLDIDNDGLDEMDLRIISTLIEKFDGGPVGLNSLSVSVSEESSTLEEVHEPFLIQEGFIKRTPKGRVATLKSYDKLGLSPN